MAEFLGNTKRTDYCGDVRDSHIGKNVTVMGWVQKSRDLGTLCFIDLRDRTGIVQLALDENSPSELIEKAKIVKSEYVIAASGVVRERASKNQAIPT